jgi:iron(III) transport system substrate-binding protein
MALRSRASVLVAAVVALVCGLGSCGPKASPQSEVVLYSSVDDPILREVAAAFTVRTGIKVLLVGDTEATKTTGLVERVIAERNSPRADVWWSNEPFGTIRLAREGLLAPYRSQAESRPQLKVDGWPAALAGAVDADGRREWYGFACRSRVIAYDTRDVAADQAPRTLRELASAQWKGRIGMARPQFGTTRGQMAMLAAECGPSALRAWLESLVANGLRLYDGNSAVVRAIAQGEIDIGLTDTDDVWSGQREGWPVAAAFEVADEGDREVGGLCSRGAMLVPCTVGLVRGAPHPVEAGVLIDFLLGPEVERLLGASDAHHLPLRGELPPEFAAFAIPGGWMPDLGATADRIAEAMDLCAEVLGTR